MIDQQFVKNLQDKSFAGQKGRVLAGFHVGSVPYGYRCDRVLDPNAPNATTQGGTLGSKLVIFEEEAEVVRRIFQMYADGKSMMGIAKLLNAEMIPSPINSRARKTESNWGSDPIKTIVKNVKYIGQYIWNVSHQEEDPDTGKIQKVDKPETEWVRIDAPELRIVSDELWAAAAERRSKMSSKQKSRVEGGYNRAKDRPYLFSGFLFCGLCGEKLIANGLQSRSRYRCENARMHRGCTSRLSIPESVLSEQLTELFASKLLSAANFEPLVSSTHAELTARFRREEERASRAGLREMESQLRLKQEGIQNLLVIAEQGPSLVVAERIAALEREAISLREKLRIAKSRRKVVVSPETLTELVRQNLSKFKKVLQEDVALARTLFEDHLVRLKLYPDTIDGTDQVCVIGEVDIFSGQNARSSGVLVGGECTPTSHQHDPSHAGIFYFVAEISSSYTRPCVFLNRSAGCSESAPSSAAALRAQANGRRFFVTTLVTSGRKMSLLGTALSISASAFTRS
ncbi:recombinase family protein [Terriglobus aquaticus]|uniref:Recombinase family protein n=1 Tax=Terriglobus aquaticus TaxID=940139 RepID=A0ABW9KJP6_9BACT|nr:recombinase family protein [Terriglobus aquaticus]